MTTRIRVVVISTFALLLPALALAGPHLICFPMSIGTAPSLPWGTGGGWQSPLASYDRARLVADTLAALGPRTPVLVRMETLRRAVIYASSDAATATRLIDALRTRAPRPGAGDADLLAVFDLGYAIEAMRQATWALRASYKAPADDGYAMVRQVLARRGPDAAMEYAAALITLSQPSRAVGDAHLRNAAAGAAESPDLARTISAHRELWGDRAALAPSSTRR